MSEHYASGSTSGYAPPRNVKKSKSIKSEEEINIQGPLEVAGSVQSGRGINFQGCISVRGPIDAYGNITTNGEISCQGQIKAYGNILINGYLASSDKIIGYGKLRVEGTLEGVDLEVWGNLIIIGFLKCRRLVLYGSLTLIGPDSTYLVEESEEIAGAKLMRDTEADWDL
ncbi:hypothetical protein THAR02_05741 [Trichoderma harzianum]|uniref:Polymer-forming cytoskeletal protein n=1 Tax=Trichoderma harzianum TaxID=5544 RepID=A0A0F9XC50_TRIHA|nr:hypothetical protein THAR02_05741 [Trichoderma harzianum]